MTIEARKELFAIEGSPEKGPAESDDEDYNMLK